MVEETSSMAGSVQNMPGHSHGTNSVLNNFDFTAIEDLDPSLGKFQSI